MPHNPATFRPSKLVRPDCERGYDNSDQEDHECNEIFACGNKRENQNDENTKNPNKLASIGLHPHPPQQYCVVAVESRVSQIVSPF